MAAFRGVRSLGSTVVEFPQKMDQNSSLSLALFPGSPLADENKKPGNEAVLSH